MTNREQNSWLRQSWLAIQSEGVARSAWQTLALRLSFVGLEFLCALALARLFQAPGYGIYAFTISCVALLAGLATLGFDRLLVREVATMRANYDWPLLRGILSRSSQLTLLVGAVLALATALVAPAVVPANSPEMLLPLRIGLLAVPILAYAKVRQAAIQGLGKVAVGQLPDMVGQPLSFLILLGAMAVGLGIPHNGVAALGLYVASTVVACLFGVWLLKASTPLEVDRCQPRYQTKRWILDASPFAGMAALSMLLASMDTIMLGIFQGPSESGTYRIASQMAMLVAFPLTAMNMAVAPTIAMLFSNRDMRGLQERAINSVRLTLLCAIPLAAVLLVFGRMVLGFFGSEFVSGYSALAILTIAYVVNAGSGTAGYLLIMTKHDRTALAVVACATALNVVGNLLLIPRWSLTGAALATGTSVVFVSAAFTVLAKKRLGIGATAWTSHT